MLPLAPNKEPAPSAELECLGGSRLCEKTEEGTVKSIAKTVAVYGLWDSKNADVSSRYAGWKAPGKIIKPTIYVMGKSR